jgi:hypothetical protein
MAGRPSTGVCSCDPSVHSKVSHDDGSGVYHLYHNRSDSRGDGASDSVPHGPNSRLVLTYSQHDERMPDGMRSAAHVIQESGPPFGEKAFRDVRRVKDESGDIRHQRRNDGS